jgi:outer membrane protein assembly factor BamB
MHSLRRSLGSVCLVALLFNSSGAAAENWPQFRGPGGTGTAADAKIPIRWSATENIVWKAALPGRGSSSPVVWGDRIFLTAYTGFGTTDSDTDDKAKLRLHVLCLNRNSGEVIWNQSIPASEHTQDFSRRIQDHGYATGTPVTDGQAVYAFFGVSGIVAYDWDGRLLWQADVGSNTAGFGSASSPVVFEDLLIVNASIESDTLRAFDKKTGQPAWTVPDIKRAWTTPCLAKTSEGAPELVLNQENTILGIDPRTGKQLWTCAGIPDYVVPVPIAHEGIVYCLGGRQNRAMAVRLGGRGDVTESHKLWDTNIGANVTSPVYYDGYLYWSSDKAIANCLNAKTGEEVYRERLKTSERVYASIVRAGKHLLLTTRDSGVVVLEAKPQYDPLAVNTIDSDPNMLNASPAISGNQVLLRTDAYLYCIGDKAVALKSTNRTRGKSTAASGKSSST